jgi:beta-ring hydroxylase
LQNCCWNDAQRLQVDAVIGDGKPTIEQMQQLKYTMRIINEAMRLYPQPPVLIRRALEEDVIGGFPVRKGQDIFISVWNLHRSPAIWKNPEDFDPMRFGPLDGPVPTEVLLISLQHAITKYIHEGLK